MLTHIVIWKYKPEVSEEQRREHVERWRRLDGLIPEIRSFAVGRVSGTSAISAG